MLSDVAGTFANPVQHPHTAPGELFRVVRVARRFNLDKMEEATGIPASRISAIERGVRIATLHEARLLWDVLSATRPPDPERAS